MAEETLTTQSVESVPEGTGSQSAEPTTQVADQSKDTETIQVENGNQQPTSSQETARPRPSDFYGIRELKRQIKQMNDLVLKLAEQKTQPPPVSTAPKPLPPLALDNDYWGNPRDYFLAKIEEIKKESEQKLQEFESQKFPQLLSQIEERKQFERQDQEALELIFPKTSSDSADWRERATKNPERTQRILEIFEETGLNETAIKNPLKAAQTVLKLYDLELKTKQSQKSPNAPTKGQMASTATGTPSGGGKRMPTINEIQDEVSKMQQQIAKNPEIFNDEKFKQRWDTLKDELVKLNKGV